MTRETRGARLYQRLLRLYPREFREEYGTEMSRLYRDRARNEGALRLWLVLLVDALRTAPREHLTMLIQDVRHAFRLFARTPIVMVTAVLTIALGVGASTAVFSVVYAVLLRPLPYPAPDRLVELFEDTPQRTPLRVSALNYLSWAERATSLEALAAFNGTGANLTDHGAPERLLGTAVTASMFDVLGVPPLAGRGFRPEDERPGAHRVVVLAESLWRRRFGGSASIVGQTITLNDERHEVIGIVPAAFRDVGRSRISSPGQQEIFLPLVIDPAQENRGNHTLRVVGRLRPGMSVDRARDEMRRIAAVMAQEFPATNEGWSVRMETLYDSMLDERVRPSLLLLLAAVGLVLLIACANVANMLLARAVARQPELALRTALGAGRSRLIRQLVTEGVCLAVVGGGCGLVLAACAVRILGVALPASLPRVDEIQIDAAVFGVGLLLSLASGLLMGLLPAARASRAALTPVLVHQGRGLAGSSRMLVRRGIVVAQMALATMLLVGAALLLQSLLRLQHVDLGFAPDGVVSARVSLPGTRYPDDARTSAFYRQLLDSLAGLPQVQAVGLGTSAPFTTGVRVGGSARDRAHAASPDAGIPAVQHIVSSGYFEALRIPLLAGRSFGPQDGEVTPAVAVVSESTARQIWGNENPIGQTLEWNGAHQYEVIGVVGDIRGAGGQARGGGVEQEPTAAVYLSATQRPQMSMTVLVRTSGEPSAIVPAIARVVQDIDPAQPVYQVRLLREWLDDSTAQPRFTTTVSAVFACVALLLAAVGVYGVLSYAVAQRTKEIGVRMAIGAERRQIVGLVLRGGLFGALAGIAIGLLGAFALSRVLRAVLFDVSAHDPLTYAAVAVMLAVVAAVACGIPAARAARIDPVTALRAD